MPEREGERKGKRGRGTGEEAELRWAEVGG
jgi:hypothetical protein